MKKTLTKRELIRMVAKRWHEAYSPFKSGQISIKNGLGEFESKESIYQKLAALDLETCSAEEIDAIIGNKSWTQLQCDQCGEDVDWIYEFGQAPDYESRTAQICATCLVRAYNQMPRGQDSGE